MDAHNIAWQQREWGIETDDEHQIYMAWKGLRHGPKEVMERLYRGEIVEPGAYYFRTTPYFETSQKSTAG